MPETTQPSTSAGLSGEWREVAAGLAGVVVRTLEIIDEGGCPAIPQHLRASLLAWSSRVDRMLDAEAPGLDSRACVYRCESCGNFLCADDLIHEGIYKNGHERAGEPCGPVSSPFGAELPA